MTSTYTIPLIDSKPPSLVDSGFYCDIRFDTDDSSPIYIGLNVQNTASTSSNDWKIYKFTYSGSNVTRIQSQTGIWDSRASLSW